MTTWFVTRHAGAVDWARERGIAVDVQVDHLDIDQVSPGDCVIGVLPVHLAAEVCARGARYFHLGLEVPREARGKEFSATEMTGFGARLEACTVIREKSEC